MLKLSYSMSFRMTVDKWELSLIKKCQPGTHIQGPNYEQQTWAGVPPKSSMDTLWCHQTWLAGKSPDWMGVLNITYKWIKRFMFHCYAWLPESRWIFHSKQKSGHGISVMTTQEPPWFTTSETTIGFTILRQEKNMSDPHTWRLIIFPCFVSLPQGISVDELYVSHQKRGT